MNDLINRQDTIDAFMKATADGDKLEFCWDVINSIPSTLIHCKNCKRFDLSPNGIGYCLRTSSFGWTEDSFCSDGVKRDE